MLIFFLKENLFKSIDLDVTGSRPPLATRHYSLYAKCCWSIAQIS